MSEARTVPTLGKRSLRVLEVGPSNKELGQGAAPGLYKVQAVQGRRVRVPINPPEDTWPRDRVPKRSDCHCHLKTVLCCLWPPTFSLN